MSSLDAFLARMIGGTRLPNVVQAKRRILQSPLSRAPDVPRGAVGTFQGEDDDFWYIDFAGPYGTVLVEPREVKVIW